MSLKLNRLNKSGFTLLEVMIALVIVGGLLVTLLYTVTQHLEVAARHELTTKAVLLGRQKLATLEPGTREAEGEFPPPDNNYHFKVDVTESIFPTIFELSVTVTVDNEQIVLKELLREGVFAR